MKKFLKVLYILISIAVIVTLTVFLVMKLKDDVSSEKNKDIVEQNIQNESEYVCKVANDRLQNLIREIEKDTNCKVEIADVGSIASLDIYFVTKVDKEYKIIVRKEVDGKEQFAVAENNEEEAKYIIPADKMGFENCISTKIEDYSIDRDGNVTYK